VLKFRLKSCKFTQLRTTLPNLKRLIFPAAIVKVGNRTIPLKIRFCQIAIEKFSSIPGPIPLFKWCSIKSVKFNARYLLLSSLSNIWTISPALIVAVKLPELMHDKIPELIFNYI